MDRDRLVQLFRHLVRDILNETDEELGMPFDEIAAFMGDHCVQMAADPHIETDHQYDQAMRGARDEVKRFANLNGSHPDHRHLLGAIQGAMSMGTRALRAMA